MILFVLILYLSILQVIIANINRVSLSPKIYCLQLEVKAYVICFANTITGLKLITEIFIDN
jgi:hypothetical protein